MNARKREENPEGNSAHTILIAEDEVLIRIVLADFLRHCGYTVIEVSHGNEAVAVLESDIAVDLVFSDVNMPGMDGIALARWMRAHRPDTPIILTSGIAQKVSEAGDLCVQEGAETVIPKPYAHADVEQRIRALLAAKRTGS